jgi:hypothetical protein
MVMTGHGGPDLAGDRVGWHFDWRIRLHGHVELDRLGPGEGRAKLRGYVDFDGA